MTTLTSPFVAVGTHAFRLASRLRGERAIHARGRAFRGTVVLPGGAGTGAPLLDTAGTYDAVVRFSRSAGLPSWLPDVGRVRTSGELPAPQGRQTRFSPANTGGGLQAAGPFQSWRARSYPASYVAPDEV